MPAVFFVFSQNTTILCTNIDSDFSRSVTCTLWVEFGLGEVWDKPPKYILLSISRITYQIYFTASIFHEGKFKEGHLVYQEQVNWLLFIRWLNLSC